MRARKDEEEGVLREVILGSSSQFVRAGGEKLFSEKLFSEPGCLGETVLEKPVTSDLVTNGTLSRTGFGRHVKAAAFS